jgi:DNA-binding CsgD family transcriptional regulator
MIWAGAAANDIEPGGTAWALDALGLVSAPTIALDARRRIVFANAAAEALLAERDGVWRQDDTLLVHAGAARRRLQDMLQAAPASWDGRHVAAPPHGSGREEFLIERPSGRAALVASAFALGGAGAEDGEARLILFLLDVDRRADLTRLLRRARLLFDLTAAEACVLEGLLLEKSVAEIAAARGVKVDTVRSQVKALLRKTRSRRQSELHRLRALLEDGGDLPARAPLRVIGGIGGDLHADK